MSSVRPSAPANWRLLLWWILATAAGFSLGSLVEAALGRSSGIMVVAYVSVGGTGAAALQWLALRKYVSQAGWWLVAGIAGGAITGLFGLAVGVVVGFATGVIKGFAGGINRGHGDGHRRGR